jgi:hypothetical protein
VKHRGLFAESAVSSNIWNFQSIHRNVNPAIAIRLYIFISSVRQLKINDETKKIQSEVKLETQLSSFGSSEIITRFNSIAYRQL